MAGGDICTIRAEQTKGAVPELPVGVGGGVWDLNDVATFFLSTSVVSFIPLKFCRLLLTGLIEP